MSPHWRAHFAQFGGMHEAFLRLGCIKIKRKGGEEQSQGIKTEGY
jgi:hypothetical protein